MDDKVIYMYKDDVNWLLCDLKGVGEFICLFLDDVFEYVVFVV